MTSPSRQKREFFRQMLPPERMARPLAPPRKRYSREKAGVPLHP